MIGQIIANYKITAAIGEGGMGIVYQAEHVHFNRKVAIKALHKKLISNNSIKERFRNEAATLSQIEHPNIVKLYDYVETEDGLFLVMEYVEGVPLDEYIKNVSGPIQESAAIKIMLGMLSGFSFAHSKNIVHRDVKPSNIIINIDFSVVKILDFGIAKILGDDSRNLTKDGSQMGTVYYMSPEQVKGLSLDKRSDIYSLGVTFFQMVTGVNPYQNLATEFEIYNQITQSDLPDAVTVYPLVPDKIDYVIKKATRKNVEERYQSCEEMIVELKNENFSTNNKYEIITAKKDIVEALVDINRPPKNKYKYGIVAISIIAFLLITFYSYSYIQNNIEVKEALVQKKADDDNRDMQDKLNKLKLEKDSIVSVQAKDARALAERNIQQQRMDSMNNAAILQSKNLSTENTINQNEVLLKMKEFYRHLSTDNFNAFDYFNNNVVNYINKQNTTPTEINNIQSNHKDFINGQSSIIDDNVTFSRYESGLSFWTMWIDFNCYRASKNKYEYCKVLVEIGFDINKKISSYKELSLKDLEFRAENKPSGEANNY